MTRILFFGDLAATGFGTVTSDLGRELLALGHDVRFMSQNDVPDLPEPFASRTFQITREMRKDAITAASDAENPERIPVSWQALMGQVAAILDGKAWPDGWQSEANIVLGDFWGVSELVFRSRETVAAFQSRPTLHYVPIEGVDLPPAWAEMWKVVRPVAMSEFGATQIEAITGSRPPVVYHGIDTETFRPFDHRVYLVRGHKVRSKIEARKVLGIPPDIRLMLRTDRFMPRKQYGSMLRALTPVMAARPDVFLLLHCDPVDEGGHLMHRISKLPGPVQGRILLTNGAKVEREMLAAMYNAADLYVSTSAEGFGLTIAEALACGTPAVAMDYSSVTEVVGDGGLLAPLDHLVDNEYDHAWAHVNEAAFGAQVAKLLDDPHLRAGLGRQARRHVVDKFRWGKAALQFSGLIREALIPEAIAA